MDTGLETADSHNRSMTGEIRVLSSEAMRPDKPVYPKPPGEETEAYRWGRSNVGYHRDAKWLEVVRAEPCMQCGAPGPSDPHHVFSGLRGTKTSDIATIPLCRSCHEVFERDRALKNRAPIMLAVFLIRHIAGMRGHNPKGMK